GLGVPEDGLSILAADLGGNALGRWLKHTVEGTDELPLAEGLKRFGVELNFEAASKAPSLGARFAGEGEGARLTHVLDDTPARRAGLSAGDVVIAANGLKVNAASLERLLARHQPGAQLRLHAFRRDELMVFDVTLAEAPLDSAKLGLAARASGAARSLRDGWLGQS
ncbi:MAG: PDZ domain-containing protein, partial [Rhodocyclales bacterium]|nr:PDZ domain-containing protein [Rhodocyclales bacterium]